MKFRSEPSVVIIIYLLLTLILTYPLVMCFNTHLAGDDGDSWQNVWNMWWMKKAITELHSSPYYTDYFHYPTGVTLLFYGLNPLNSLLSIPFQYVFDRITIYNTIFVIAFTFSGFTMYLLALYLTKNKFASIIAGFIFTFSPFHMAHGLGHLQLINMEFIPLFILYLFKTSETGNNNKHMILSAIFLILVALCDWYYLFFCAMFLIFYIFYLWFIKRSIPLLFIKKSGYILTIAFIALLPFFIAMAKEMLKDQFLGVHPPEEYSADLLSFFIPGYIQTMGRFCNFFKTITFSFTGNEAENANYIGYAVLFLSLYSFKRLRKENKFISFFFFSGVIFFILSLGMHLHVMGRVITKIPLPYNFLYKTFFFFRFSGIPGRFDVMVVTCLSLLAGFGLKNILLMKQKAKRYLAVSIIIFFVFVEYLCVPFPVTSFEIPRFFKTMANDAESYGIIYMPTESRKAFYYQTIHHKKIVWGDIGRYPESAEKSLKLTPIVGNIIWNIYPVRIGDKQIPDSQVQLMARKVFNNLSIKYVIIEKDNRNKFVDYYKFTKIYEDNNIKVYVP